MKLTIAFVIVIFMEVHMMKSYLYLILVLIACLMAATAILFEQLSNITPHVLDEVEKIEHELYMENVQ